MGGFENSLNDNNTNLRCHEKKCLNFVYRKMYTGKAHKTFSGIFILPFLLNNSMSICSIVSLNIIQFFGALFIDKKSMFLRTCSSIELYFGVWQIFRKYHIQQVKLNILRTQNRKKHERPGKDTFHKTSPLILIVKLNQVRDANQGQDV